MSWLSYIPADPVNLNAKDKLTAALSCFAAILAIAWLGQGMSQSATYPMLVASMGASAVLLFINPNSPLVQPWPLVGGQLMSATVGVICAQYVADTILASALAVGGSVMVMLLLRCLHPPGAATALVPVLGGQAIATLGFSFVFMPVGFNSAIMLALAIAINQLWRRHDYPIKTKVGVAPKADKQRSQTSPAKLTDITEQEVEQALKKAGLFIDASPIDLIYLLFDIQQDRFQQSTGQVTCADVMNKDFLAIEYGDEVEQAWRTMRHKNLMALPVVDRARHVIGMVTVQDFIKHIEVEANEKLPDKFFAFIRRTPHVATTKPESAGHIMSAPVRVMREDAHIAELMALMIMEEYSQIPIVNKDNRLVGMAYQDQLISVLYSKGLTSLVEIQRL